VTVLLFGSRVLRDILFWGTIPSTSLSSVQRNPVKEKSCSSTPKNRSLFYKFSSFVGYSVSTSHVLLISSAVDVNEATNEESFEPVPMVDVMLIDPDFPVEDAIRQGLVSTVTTPANGLSKVGIRLNRVQKLNEKPQYKYGLHADHFPARSMPCDISGGKEPSDVCTGAVHFQVDSFDRSTNSQVWRLGPWVCCFLACLGTSELIFLIGCSFPSRGPVWPCVHFRAHTINSWAPCKHMNDS
jgi:hypothetical protein